MWFCVSLSMESWKCLKDILICGSVWGKYNLTTVNFIRTLSVSWKLSECRRDWEILIRKKIEPFWLKVILYSELGCVEHTKLQENIRWRWRWKGVAEFSQWRRLQFNTVYLTKVKNQWWIFGFRIENSCFNLWLVVGWCCWFDRVGSINWIKFYFMAKALSSKIGLKLPHFGKPIGGFTISWVSPTCTKSPIPTAMCHSKKNKNMKVKSVEGLSGPSWIQI